MGVSEFPLVMQRPQQLAYRGLSSTFITKLAYWITLWYSISFLPGWKYLKELAACHWEEGWLQYPWCFPLADQSACLERAIPKYVMIWTIDSGEHSLISHAMCHQISVFLIRTDHTWPLILKIGGILFGKTPETMRNHHENIKHTYTSRCTRTLIT